MTSSRVTTYTYNVASQLRTSKVDVEPTTWYYAFDNNGNLREMTPNGSTPGNGAIRYTYNAASQLSKVEMHNGSSYAKIAEMSHDGEGNRARLVAWVGGTPLTTTYTYQLVEQVQVLQARNGSNTTTYLYGVNPIGEFGTQSVYYLADGAGSVRQLANPSGFVVLSRWYEPFGQILTQKGTAVATYGYLGAQLDRVTGLLYINGRYYDPITGRYLTPGGGANPYVPLQISGALLGPLALLSAAAQRNRKRRKWLQLLLVVLVLFAVGGMLVSCNEPPPPQPPQPPSPQPPAPGPGPSPSPTPPADWFSSKYGSKIAQRARELVQLSNSNKIQVIREMNSCWDISELGKITNYVCADVVTDSYYAAGVDLQKLLLTSGISKNWQYPCAAIHNAQSLGQYLQATGQLRNGHDFPYYQGEIVIGYPDWAHAAVVVEGGYNQDAVRLVQASYSSMRIEELTLREWKNKENGPGESVWHGHPSQAEINRIAQAP